MNPAERKRRSRWLAGPALLCLGLGLAVLVVSAAPEKSPDQLFGLWRLRHVALAVVLFLAAFGGACAARGREVLIAFWATVLPVGALFAALELSGRAGLVDWNALLEPRPVPGESEGVGWSLRPDIDVQGKTGQDIAARLGLAHAPIPFRFSTDRYGFRNGRDPQGQIVLLGDSIVLGAAVPHEQTVAEVVKRALGEPAMQAALLGLSVQEQHDMLLSSGLPLAGKTVVQFVFEGNDLLDSRDYRQNAARQGAETGGGDPAGSASFLDLIWSRLVRLSNPPAKYSTCRIGEDRFAFLWTRRSFEGVAGEFENIARAITRFEAELAKSQARLMLVFVPTKYRVLEPLCTFPPESLIADREENLSDLPDQLARWSDEANLQLLDLTEPLKAAAKSGAIPWFWGDTHWNATGHDVAGREIANWLRSNSR